MSLFQACKIKVILALLSFVVLFTTNIVWHGIAMVVLAIFVSRRLRELKNTKFWLIFSLFSFLPCVFIQTYQIFLLSCLVLCRSIIVYLALLTIAENINLNTLSRNMPKIVGKRLAMIVVLAFNLMPIVRNILIKNYALFYFKKATNISTFKKTISYVLVVFRQVINAADSCAENMFLSHKLATPKIIVISGAKHAGKTTYAATLVEEFGAKNWPVSGILAPSTMENNRRTTIYLTDLQTGGKKLLASREDIIIDTAYTYGGFQFSRSGYQFARNALLNYTPGGIVFLDEFGPLEFAHMGHAVEFYQLLKANISALYVVMREDLINRFSKEFPTLAYDVIKVEDAKINLLPVVSNAPVLFLDK